MWRSSPKWYVKLGGDREDGFLFLYFFFASREDGFRSDRMTEKKKNLADLISWRRPIESTHFFFVDNWFYWNWESAPFLS